MIMLLFTNFTLIKVLAARSGEGATLWGQALRPRHPMLETEGCAGVAGPTSLRIASTFAA